MSQMENKHVKFNTLHTCDECYNTIHPCFNDDTHSTMTVMVPCGPCRDWLMRRGCGSPICEGARKHDQGACETLETTLLNGGAGETAKNGGTWVGELVNS
jgi:hypothetical protein